MEVYIHIKGPSTSDPYDLETLVILGSSGTFFITTSLPPSGSQYSEKSSSGPPKQTQHFESRCGPPFLSILISSTPSMAQYQCGLDVLDAGQGLAPLLGGAWNCGWVLRTQSMLLGPCLLSDHPGGNRGISPCICRNSPVLKIWDCLAFFFFQHRWRKETGPPID